MNQNNLKSIRKQLGHTQSSLAEQTNLSIRTIQRIESGQTDPKGHTLTVLAETLGIDKTELFHQEGSTTELSRKEEWRLKMLNLSSLCFIGIPFGNIIIPFIILMKSEEHPVFEEVGRKIINFQILWTICLSVLLILSPFFQVYVPFEFPLILIVGLLACIINVLFILKTANALTDKNYDILPLKIRFV